MQNHSLNSKLDIMLFLQIFQPSTNTPIFPLNQPIIQFDFFVSFCKFYKYEFLAKVLQSVRRLLSVSVKSHCFTFLSLKIPGINNRIETANNFVQNVHFKFGFNGQGKGRRYGPGDAHETSFLPYIVIISLIMTINHCNYCLYECTAITERDLAISKSAHNNCNSVTQLTSNE